ncbi:pectin lyase fold/virulence factor [Gymnopilus junonius]|uniref:pectinesterase n=1 Tax=Gymnopilus junonius TaxID=109634 RepID=A0A9P5TIG8_GYMJU|nr:pectin lyase fold/virulence factor [Gymnopilus junonius]
MMLKLLLNFLPLGCSLFFKFAAAQSRTVPPAGALSIRAGASSSSGVFASINAALSKLPNDNTPQTLFIFPGVYNEQVDITRPGPLTIYGYTTDTSNFAANQVVIQAGVPASTAGSDDASGTLRIHKDNFSMYNVNVTNTFGVGSQAIAISQYGSQVGLYACGFIGYQDTLYANKGTQVFLKSYIEGAVDLSLADKVWPISEVTPSHRKRQAALRPAEERQTILEVVSIQNFKVMLNISDGVRRRLQSEHNNFSQRCGAKHCRKSVPWSAMGRLRQVSRTSEVGPKFGNTHIYPRVIFKNTVITAPLNQIIWSIWNPGDERTDNVLFAEYNSTGSGITNPVRPSFSTLLTASQAAGYDISSAVGANFASWVDEDYLV